MKVVVTIATVGLIFLLAEGILAQTPENTSAALESKLHGEWQGQSACQGDLVLRDDGTFEKIHCGPGNNRFTGLWEVKWDALPPTLVMTCKTTDDPTAVGKVDAPKLIKLSDKEMALSYPPSDFRWEYARMAE